MNQKRLLTIMITLTVIAFFVWKRAFQNNDLVKPVTEITATQSEPEPELKPEPEPKPEPELKPEQKPEPEPESELEPNLESESEPEQELNPELELELESEPESVVEETYTYGDSGRLLIPDVGISVALYYSGADELLNQQLVDLEDSASLFDYRKNGDWSLGIADHNNQGFDGLYYVVPGTIAYIMHSDGKKENLECIYKDGNAISDGYYITDSMGRYVTFINPDYIYMYTCNEEGWRSVTVTIWKYI